MKKLLAVLLLLSMVLGLAACGGTTPPAPETPETPPVSDTPDTPAEPTPAPVRVPVTLELASAQDKIKTYGRTFYTDTGLRCDWAASGIEFVVDCEGDIKLGYMATVPGYLQIFVDGEAGARPMIEEGGDSKEIVIAEGLTAGEHTIRVIRDHDIDSGGGVLVLQSLQYTGFADSFRAAAEKDLYIEFIGDSITSGIGIMDGSRPYVSRFDEIHSPTHSYAYLTAQLLDADWSLVSRNGIGLFKGTANGNKNAFDMYPSYNCWIDGTQDYDFARKADIVVLALGTNDRSVVSSGDEFIGGVKKMMDLIREKHGADVKIVCVWGMMSSALGTEMTKVAGDNGAYCVRVTQNNEGAPVRDGATGHPIAEAHAVVAQELSTYIRERVLQQSPATDDPKPESPFVAIVTTGDKVVEAVTLDEMIAAVDASGNSVVTLQKDITTDSAIMLPYCCTFDFNGFTVQTDPSKGNGIHIQAVGTENKMSTFKNGTLIHYDAGLRLTSGGFVVDNMTILSNQGAPICLMDTEAGTENVIRNSFLASKAWGCFSFNNKNKDFSSVRVTVESSKLVSYKKNQDSTSVVFVKQAGAIAGELVFGKDVELYSYNGAYANAEYTRISGQKPAKVDDKATVMVGDKKCSRMNLWSSNVTADSSNEEKPAILTGAEPITEVPIPAAWSDYLVGFGRADITPTDSVPLAGYGYTSSRMSTGVLSELTATAVAVTGQGGETVFLMALDLINDRGDIAADIRSGIAAKTGVPAGNVFVTYSHTHSAPDLDNTSATSYMRDYRELVVSQAIAAGEAAWKDRKAAEMSVGATDFEGYNFNRHYIHENGEISTPGTAVEKVEGSAKVGHVAEADPEIRLIRFTRPGYEDVVLMNWQAHNAIVSYQRSSTEDYKMVSADFTATTRVYLEKKLGCKFAYFQGAAGDIQPRSLITVENKVTDLDLYAKKLGDAAISCLNDKMVKASAGAVKVHNFTYDAPVNHADAHLLDTAQQVKAEVAKSSISDSSAVARKYGLISIHHASSIIRCAGLGETVPVPCAVVSVGTHYQTRLLCRSIFAYRSDLHTIDFFFIQVADCGFGTHTQYSLLSGTATNNDRIYLFLDRIQRNSKTQAFDTAG